MASDAPLAIEPAEELDLASAPHLGRAVLDALERGDRHVVVDFARVRMIDSAGIGVLLSAERRVRAAGGRLVVANPSDHVRKIFELTGVARSLALD